MIRDRTLLQKLAVSPSATLGEAVRTVNEGGFGLAVVQDEDGKFLGILADGDIRRAILGGITLENVLTNLYQKNPVTVAAGATGEMCSEIMRKCQVPQLPILDGNNFLVGLAIWSDKENDSDFEFENRFIIMAGGRGRRLHPFTQDVPKALVPINGKPMARIIIEKAKAEGFRNFYFSINHLGDQIEDEFGDGSAMGVNISYIKEKEPLGTIGSLSLMELDDRPVVVTNCDVITEVKYSSILRYHRDFNASATICALVHQIQNPFGVLQISKAGYLTGLEEKPIYTSYINAGIYIFERDVLVYLKRGEFNDAPCLIRRIMERRQDISVFPLHENWFDVGRPSDLVAVSEVQNKE